MCSRQACFVNGIVHSSGESIYIYIYMYIYILAHLLDFSGYRSTECVSCCNFSNEYLGSMDTASFV